MDEVFARVNACGSLLGEAYLYAQLHEMCGEETLQKRRALCKMLEASPQLCFDVRLLFAKLGRRRGADPAFVLPTRARSCARRRCTACGAWLPLAALPLALFSAAGGAAFIAACCLNVLLYQRGKTPAGGKERVARLPDARGGHGRRAGAAPAERERRAAAVRRARRSGAAAAPLVSARMKLSMPRSEEADTLTEWRACCC